MFVDHPENINEMDKESIRALILILSVQGWTTKK